MIKYSGEQLATVIALPVVTTLLIWTIAIFHKNRKKWGPYDIPIVSVLVLSVIRNLTVLAYLLVVTLSDSENFNLDYCSVVVWIFNSIHTFQASSLTTIAVIGLFSAKLHRKQQNLRLFLTPTHIIYHLFCLTTLCACVGVAAILAQNDKGGKFENLPGVIAGSPCKFMPFDLDIKFNVFIIALHVFLAVVSFFSFLIICYNFYKVKKRGFDFLKKSNSDLSDMSIGLANTLNVNVAENNKNFYDTYTVQHRGQNAESNYYEAYQQNPNPHLQNGFCGTRDVNWNSDLSNISATVSSTNSRRPCLGQNHQDKDAVDQIRTGLETIHPVLIVCYLFYHLPLIILCIYPKLVYPWPVAGVGLWLGLVQDVLIPIGLGIVDSRFCKWVSNVYRCSNKNVQEKLPHVGLDGKFRPFGSPSQPQSLDIASQDRTMRAFQTIEHRFPITNGSLYTSIDGRLPVIHNYRRNKDQRGGLKPQEKQSSNVAIHSSHLNRVEFSDSTPKFPSCTNCEADLCPSHSNLHHLSPHYINKQLNLLQQNPSLMITKNVVPVKVSHSEESLNYLSDVQNRHFFCRNSDLNLNGNMSNHIMKNSRNLVRLNRMRLSRSEDSLTDLQREIGNISRPTPQKMMQVEDRPPPKRLKNFRTKVEVSIQNGYSSSDEDYHTDVNEATVNNPNTFDSLSSKSCYSITTEANCDFDFFQSNERLSNDIPLINTHNSIGNSTFVDNSRSPMSSFSPIDLPSSRTSSQLELGKNFRITRSNSKRSLESFQAFVEAENVDLKNNINSSRVSTLQRSNSYMTLEDRHKHNKHLLRSDSKMLDHFDSIRQKIKSIEYLPSSNTSSTVFIDDVSQFSNCFDVKSTKYVGSVPDLKKVFISEYI